VTPSATSYPLAEKICARNDCSFAGKPQPIINFRTIRTGKLAGKPFSYCRPCESRISCAWYRKQVDEGNGSWIRELGSMRSQKWARENREKKRLMSIAKRMRRQGVDPGWYETTLQSQGGVCAMCGKPPSLKIRLSVDHDHSCCPKKRACDNCRRSLLCGPCNTALGHIENSEWVEKAHAYLAKWQPLEP
jgi:hypothetical protein